MKFRQMRHNLKEIKMSTRELVDALVSGDSIAIENTFNAVMSQRVSAALDAKRIEVAQSMFVPPEEIVNTDDTSQQA